MGSEFAGWVPSPWTRITSRQRSWVTWKWSEALMIALKPVLNIGDVGEEVALVVVVDHRDDAFPLALDAPTSTCNR